MSQQPAYFVAFSYAPPLPPSRLPVVDTEYHHFWRTPAWRWWRPVVALLAFAFVFFVIQLLVLLAAVAIDASTGRISVSDFLDDASQGVIRATPVFFLSNNVGLALLIPVSLLLGWWLFGQRPKWLSSVVGSIRWGWLLRCTLVLLPLWIVYLAFDSFMVYRAEGTLGLEANGDTWLLLLGILLTTPFQAAGEEYAFRGFLARSASSFFPWSKVGLLVSMIFSSTLFMLAHGAGDPWLNLFYFSFGLVASIMTWWTGGLEAAIAMHVVNNVLSELVLPFQDISNMFDRAAGVAGPEVLIGIAVPVVGLGLVMWQAKRHHIVRVSAPAFGYDLPAELQQYPQQWHAPQPYGQSSYSPAVYLPPVFPQPQYPQPPYPQPYAPQHPYVSPGDVTVPPDPGGVLPPQPSWEAPPSAEPWPRHGDDSPPSA